MYGDVCRNVSMKYLERLMVVYMNEKYVFDGIWRIGGFSVGVDYVLWLVVGMDLCLCDWDD